jgi:transcriptional regulator with XRE-family HTH domain
MSIASYLFDEFLKWQAEQGERKTVVDFAQFLSVPESTLSEWMSGKYIPKGKNLKKLAIRLGSQIYGELEIITGPVIIFHTDHRYTPEEITSISEECEDYLDSIPGLTRSQRQEKLIECYIKKGFVLLSKK